MRLNKNIFYTFCLLALLSLTRCGKDQVCVMGMGTCDVPKSTTTQTGESKDLILIVDQEIIKVNQKATFTANGGRKPYTFERFDGLGTVDQTTKTETSIVYTAPSFTGTFTMRVIDANNNYKTLSITIEQ